VEVWHGAGSGSNAIQIRAGVLPTFTVVSSTNARWTSLGSAPKNPRTGPSLRTHLHIETWPLIMMSLRDFEARLGDFEAYLRE